MTSYISTPLSTFANVRTLYIPNTYTWNMWGRCIWDEMLAILFAQPAALRVLGLDIEWYCKSPPSVLQLATHTHCFVIHLSLLNNRSVPNEVVQLLEDPRCIKSGVGIQDDVKKLANNYHINIQTILTVDKFSKSLGLIEGNKCGLKALTHMFLNFELEKKVHTTISNWELQLEKSQIEYAADDAIASCLIGRYIMKKVIARSLLPRVENHSESTMALPSLPEKMPYQYQKVKESQYTEQERQKKWECEQWEYKMQWYYNYLNSLQNANELESPPSYPIACASLLSSNPNTAYIILATHLMPYDTNMSYWQQEHQQQQQQQQDQQQQQEMKIICETEVSKEQNNRNYTNVSMTPEEIAVQKWLASSFQQFKERDKQAKDERKKSKNKCSTRGKQNEQCNSVIVLNAEGEELTRCTYNEAKRFTVLDRIAYVVNEGKADLVNNNVSDNSENSSSTNSNNSNNSNSNDNNTTEERKCATEVQHRPRIIRLISNDAGKRRLCQLHRLGQCKRGNQCLYAHSIDDLIVDNIEHESNETNHTCYPVYEDYNYDEDEDANNNDNNNNVQHENAEDWYTPSELNEEIYSEHNVNNTNTPFLQPVCNNEAEITDCKINSKNVESKKNETNTNKEQVHKINRFVSKRDCNTHEHKIEEFKCYKDKENQEKLSYKEEKPEIEEFVQMIVEKEERPHEQTVAEILRSTSMEQTTTQQHQQQQQQQRLTFTNKHKCNNAINNDDVKKKKEINNKVNKVINLPSAASHQHTHCVQCYGNINLISHSIVPPSLQRYLPASYKQRVSNKTVSICLSCHRHIWAHYDHEMTKLFAKASDILHQEINIERMAHCYNFARSLSRPNTIVMRTEMQVKEMKAYLLKEWKFTFVRELANDYYNPTIRSIEDIDNELIKRIANNVPGKARCAITMKALVGDDEHKAKEFVDHWMNIAASLKLIASADNNEYDL